MVECLIGIALGGMRLEEPHTEHSRDRYKVNGTEIVTVCLMPDYDSEMWRKVETLVDPMSINRWEDFVLSHDLLNIKQYLKDTS